MKATERPEKPGWHILLVGKDEATIRAGPLPLRDPPEWVLCEGEILRYWDGERWHLPENAPAVTNNPAPLPYRDRNLAKK